MQWSSDDYQMPVCFFESVAFCCRLNGIKLPFERFWWGHRFYDDRLREGINLPLTGATNLTGVYSYPNPYGLVAEAPIYISMRRVVPLQVSVQLVHDVTNHLDMLSKRLREGQYQVIPFPLCLSTGFRDMVRPNHHYATVSMLEDGRFNVIDQHNSAQLTRDQFVERMMWFSQQYSYLPLYDVGEDRDWVETACAHADAAAFGDLLEYERTGRSLLGKWVNEAERLDDEVDSIPLPTENLWKIARCRLAELRYVGAGDADLLRALTPLVSELAKRWRQVAALSVYKQTSRSGKVVRLGDAAAAVFAMEEDYFGQLADLKARARAQA